MTYALRGIAPVFLMVKARLAGTSTAILMETGTDSPPAEIVPVPEVK